ncbi:hypothetical protein [Roseateles albus]|uniref:CPBP family intramembrane metalloprotease n=1 Tax=Roseateles albus TaxID=2987525 RepID=A0ABT5KKX9_9BURK|nr:hypothetical protein [Roseateles albus]MDC8774593.1 hypothetical protein [Roseateles albus]
MRRLLGFLLHPEVSLWKYCLSLVPLALIPSAFLVLLATLTAEAAGLNAAAHSAPAIDVTLGNVFGAVVFSPIVETFMLAGLLKVLSSTSLHPAVCAAFSAVLWGGLHGLVGALWFFGTVWGFFVFSCGYIAWRHTSLRQGFLAAAVPHALANSIAMLLLWVA